MLSRNITVLMRINVRKVPILRLDLPNSPKDGGKGTFSPRDRNNPGMSGMLRFLLVLPGVRAGTGQLFSSKQQETDGKACSGHSQPPIKPGGNGRKCRKGAETSTNSETGVDSGHSLLPTGFTGVSSKKGAGINTKMSIKRT